MRLGLVVAELVRSQNLQAKPEQLQAHIEEISQPATRSRRKSCAGTCRDRERMAEVEAVVIENNVTDFILGKAKITDKQLPFDELMATA